MQEIEPEHRICERTNIVELLEFPRSSAPNSTRSSAPTSCIYIVDDRIRNLKPDAYTPDTVSIGPYHRHDVRHNLQMQVMEGVKSRYVKALVDRTGISREGYKEAIKEIKPHPRKYYEFDYLNEEEFVEIMFLDGLFVIELFRKYAKAKAVRDAKQSAVHEVDKNVVSTWMEKMVLRWTQTKKVVLRWMQTKKKDADEEIGVDRDAVADEDIGADAVADEESGEAAGDAVEDDPIFYSNLKRTRVIRDLVLLENQIPMSVLQALFEKSQNGDSNQFSLVELALDFFDSLIPGAKDKYTSSKEKWWSNIQHKHLLDLLRFTLEAPLPPHKEQLSTRTRRESLPCVTELRHSGVQFKRSGNKNGSLMDLKFNKNGVFEIPPIYVSDFTDPFFRNLMKVATV